MNLSPFRGAAIVALAALAAPLTAQSQLCTIQPFAADNGGVSGGLVLFDLTVTNAVRIVSLDTNVGETAPFGMNVYTTPGSYVGNEANPAAWTLAATDDGNAIGQGIDNVSTVTLASPLILTPGSYGVALELVNASHEYTNGDGTNQNFSNADLAIALGSAMSARFSGLVFSPRVWNGCVNYTPATGLFPSFDATPRSGAAPLNVQFTDTSFSSDPAGITGWSWDLDGDGNVDSTQQNPVFSYGPGSYDVTLTVTDAGGQQSVTETGFIVSDPLTADFTASATVGTVPFTVNFTDASQFNPTSWAWDFDNDGTVDSTQQNPSFTYQTAGTYTVSLQVGNAAFTDTETKVDLIVAVGATNNTESPAILEYQFNEPRGDRVANTASTTLAPAFGSLPTDAWQADPGRDLFDGNDPGTGALGIDATSPYDNYVDSGWTVDLTGSHTISFWSNNATGTTSFSYPFGVTGGGTGRCYYTGSVLSLRSWGDTSIPFVDTATDPEILTGWHNWVIVVDDANGTAQWYLDGTPDGAPVSFTPNSFTYAPGGRLLVGAYGTSTSRFTRYYEMDDFRIYARALTPAEVANLVIEGENPTTSTFGDGCDGPNGPPRIGAAGGAPRLGNITFTIEVSNLEVGVPQLLNLGIFAIEPGLPFDLDPFLPNGTGCTAQIYPGLVGVSMTGNADFSFSLPIVNDPALAGFHILAQAIVVGSQGAVSPTLILNPQF